MSSRPARWPRRGTRNKFVDPVHDGAVLPILHLNGYKIANPTIPARIHREELESLLRGYGHEVLTVEGDDPADVHQQMAATLDRAHDRSARSSAPPARTATSSDGRGR